MYTSAAMWFGNESTGLRGVYEMVGSARSVGSREPLHWYGDSANEVGRGRRRWRGGNRPDEGGRMECKAYNVSRLKRKRHEPGGAEGRRRKEEGGCRLPVRRRNSRRGREDRCRQEQEVRTRRESPAGPQLGERGENDNNNLGYCLSGQAMRDECLVDGSTMVAMTG